MRVLLDLLSLAVPTRGSPSPTSSSPRSSGPSSGQITPPTLQLPPGGFGKCHSTWRILQIARAIGLNYNLSAYYLILVIIFLVIILQEPLFLRDMIKYIQ
jgi:hypothetical protein